MTSAPSSSGIGVETLADLGAQPRQALCRSLAQRLQPGAALAGLGDCRVGAARRIGGLAQRRFRAGQGILGPLPVRGRRRRIARQRLALDGDLGRPAGQFGDLRRQRVMSLGQDTLLRRSPVAALAP